MQYNHCKRTTKGKDKVSQIRKELLQLIDPSLHILYCSVKMQMVFRSQLQRKIDNGRSFKFQQSAVKSQLAVSDKLRKRRGTFSCLGECREPAADRRKLDSSCALAERLKESEARASIEPLLKAKEYQRIERRLPEAKRKDERERLLKERLSYMFELAAARRNCFDKGKSNSSKIPKAFNSNKKEERTENGTVKEEVNNARISVNEEPNASLSFSCKHEYKEKEWKLVNKSKRFSLLLCALEEISLAPIETLHLN
eukprot:TRINITY_DN9344_c0_g3_i2.p1 TRINITY_DN9344_c0_g3~~TRINITY_DN9344_c0_g3_i2.p1  ORF type:complete len:255 (-),score=60.64 TRINITY_DN9344_c0_g3_i2:110-874(-)